MMELYRYKDKSALRYAQEVCDNLMRQYEAENLPPKGHFHYHQGVFLSGVEKVYMLSKEEKYKQYIESWVNSLLTEDGKLIGFDSDELDDVQPGILMYRMYNETKKSKYEKAIHYLMEVVKNFPTNREGGFWHKVKCKEQMWLDGLYMCGPFTAMYGKMFDDPTCFDICIFQANLMMEKTRDEKTGLFYHAWDSLKERPWANKETGCSAEFWGRALGWVPIALLDEIEYIPKNYSGYDNLVKIVKNLLISLEKYQDETGLWYQVINKGHDENNWLETSCTCLFSAAISKAVRLGVLEKSHQAYAIKAFEGVIDRLKYNGEDILIGGICVGTGVGDFMHYCNRPTRVNDLHGIGAYLLMCAELEMAMK